MMELIDEKTKKRLDTISECFDLEDYFKKIESKSKDILSNSCSCNNKRQVNC